MEFDTSKRTVRIMLVAFLILIVVSSTPFINSAFAYTQADVTVDSTNGVMSNSFAPGFMLDHEWKEWRDTAAQRELASNASLKIVRFFGDGKSSAPRPCTYWYESSKTGTFSWTAIDGLVKRIFESGAEPLITLGGIGGYGGSPWIPKGMAVNPTTNLPYYESFAAYAATWVRHFKSIGMPVKYWDIWNEAWYYFFYSWGNVNPTKLKYFVDFFNTIYTRMREVDPTVLLSTDSSTFKGFLDYFVKYGKGLGYLSFHKYDSGSTSESDSTVLNLVDKKFFQTNSAYYSPEAARQVWYNARGAKLPVIITETNFSYIWRNGSEPRIQKMVGAVWTALLMRISILKGITSSTYYKFSSSKYYESQRATGGYGFGMVNSDNEQPWYPYYVHKLIGNNLAVGDPVVYSSSSSSEISTLAWVHKQILNLFIVRKVDSSATIYLRGISGQLTMFKLDNNVYWKTPKVQTSVISASNPINLIGYTVLLLQKPISQSPPPPEPPPTPTGYIFEDGFESGKTDKWTATYVTSGETATVVSTSHHHGSYDAKFTSNGGGSEERAYASKDISDLSEVYVRGYFYIASGLPHVDEGDRFNFIAIEATGGSIIATVSVQRQSGIDRWAIKSQTGTTTASSGPTMGQWYCIELYAKIDSTQGAYSLWINGQKVIDWTGLNTATEGIATSVRAGLTYAYGVTKNIVAYTDCLAISETYIGPEQ